MAATKQAKNFSIYKKYGIIQYENIYPVGEHYANRKKSITKRFIGSVGLY